MMNESQHYAFILIPGFSLVALSCAIDVLRAANIEVGYAHYQWTLAGAEDENIHSSSGLAMPMERLADLARADAVVICGGDRSHSYTNERLDSFLQSQARKKHVRIGSFSDGAFVVAGAGLFKRTRSTIHWKCLDAYRERYPDLDIRASILEIDGQRFSCAGGTSSLDLMLNFVHAELGAGVVRKIADNYFHSNIRDSGEVQQSSTTAYKVAKKSQVLSTVLLQMNEHIEEPISIAELADSVSVSHRKLERLFKKYFAQSPSVYYRDIRLARAASLLAQTEMKVSEIAVACGFQSASHLGKYFQVKYKQTPGKFRQIAS